MSTEFGAYAVYLPPGPDIVAYLEEVERRVGLLPLSLRAWYEVVGSVNLMGSHPDFGDPDYDLLDPWWCCLSRR
jgi:hypothetical protein